MKTILHMRKVEIKNHYFFHNKRKLQQIGSDL